jgi:FtsP/CotA-like multicopper oxidase with cupredoxin domain
MTTIQWILLDHVAALVSVAAWFAAGVTTALNRVRLGFGFLVAAVVATLIRVSTVVALALTGGWWFAQEKVLLGLPMLTVTGFAAALIAGRPLLEARQGLEQVLPASGVVALLTAAYAALAGLVVTFLFGHPLTWGAALITIAIVCLGALLTARAVTAKADDATESVGEDDAPATARTPDSRPVFSRRQVMTLAGSAVVVGAGSAGAGLSFLPTESVTSGGGPPRLPYPHPQVSVASLRGERRPAPGGTARRHVLTAQKATVRLPSGRELDAWTYAGQLPGPAIAATEGDLIEVTLRNADIEDGVTLHWHGYDVACGEDGAPGVTQHAVAPGEEFVYHFRADQVGTYWYHTHQASHQGVRKGLYGTLVVHPRAREPDRGQTAADLDLTLPVHTFDDILLIGDQDARADHTVAPGTLVRLRLINTDSDPHRFALVGAAFRVAGVDGRDLSQPGEVSEVGLRLPAGGRYDLIFDMPGTPVALLVDNDRDGGVRLHTNRDSAAAEAAVDDTSNWPELDLLHYGGPAPAPFDGSRPDRHFTIVLDRGVAMVDGRLAYAHTVNGQGHPSIPDQLVAEGDLVRFTVVNRSLETHPWHLHGHPVLILSRDGTPSSGSPLWVDTFDVRPGEVWEVAFKATNLGIWMNHCHNLPHMHQGMMLRLAYAGVSSPFGEAHTGHA